MSDVLVAIANGKRMGKVELRGDRLSFQYEIGWQNNAAAFPLSLSMPLITAEHEHRVVDAFLWGLLPDNDGVLERWGQRFQVSPRNPFRLLQNVGEDCAGAVQFVRPERVAGVATVSDAPAVHWLTEEEVAMRIKTVIADAAATRLGEDTGQFSLAGAQPKIALYFDRDQERWGVPEGRTPTTHILKPATGAFDGQAENEHFCLKLAAALGFATAQSYVRQWNGVPVIVVERFDRIGQGGTVRRVHQEDFCQAAGIRPQLKYQSQGGPSPKSIGEILWNFSSSPEEDVVRFADALIFNWLIAGTDAHAKNFSMLIAAGGRARLAPLYDLASAIPYPQQVQPRKAKLAMKVGSHYRIQEIRRGDWEKLARELRLSAGKIGERIHAVAAQVAEAAIPVAQSIENEGIAHPVVGLLSKSLASHVQACLQQLDKPPGRG